MSSKSSHQQSIIEKFYWMNKEVTFDQDSIISIYGMLPESIGIKNKENGDAIVSYIKVKNKSTYARLEEVKIRVVVDDEEIQKANSGIRLVHPKVAPYSTSPQHEWQSSVELNFGSIGQGNTTETKTFAMIIEFFGFDEEQWESITSPYINLMTFVPSYKVVYEGGTRLGELKIHTQKI